MKIKMLAAALPVVATLGYGAAAQAAEATASAGGRIIAALQIKKSTDLYFGSIVPSNTAADTVEVDSAGALTCGAELTCLGDGVSAAGFAVAGEPDMTYAITLPDSVSISNGTDTMTIVDMIDSVGGSSTLGAGGTEEFTVGGTLAVAAAQSTGQYTGTFNVAVEYN